MEEEQRWSAAVLDGRWQQPVVSTALGGTRELWSRLKAELADLDTTLAAVSEGGGPRKSLQADTAERLEQIEEQSKQAGSLHNRILAVVEVKLQDGTELEKEAASTIKQLEEDRWGRHRDWLAVMRERAERGEVLCTKSAKAVDAGVPEAARLLAMPATEAFDRSLLDSDISMSQAEEKTMDKLQRYQDLSKLEQKLDDRRRAARDALKEIEVRGVELDRRYEYFKHMEGRTLELRTKTE